MLLPENNQHGEVEGKCSEDNLIKLIGFGTHLDRSISASQPLKWTFHLKGPHHQKAPG